MQAEERQHQILISARADGSVDVAKLAAELGVAPETVRRDLRVLERHGLVHRTHGGAYPVETSQFETSLAMRTTRRVPEKRRIALAAVELLGGRVRGRTLATVDHWTTQMLSGFVLDLAFIGANGISRERGLTTPDPAVAEVKAQVVRAARRLVFCGVHTKFGVSTFCRFAEIGDLETIVTDVALPATEAHRYSLLGPQVIRV